MDKLEIIDLLLDKYIKDPSTRAIQDGIPRYITCDGKTCPVGSVLREKELFNVFGDIYTLVSTALKLLPNVSTKHISYLPKNIVEQYYEGHHTNFWDDLRRFHDTDKFFTDKTISEDGRQYIVFLRNKWNQLKHPKL